MSRLRGKQRLDILLCEDNLGDVYLINKSLQNSAIEYSLHHVDNGEAALDYLQQKGDDQGRNRPDLILLDLNLPKKNGLEILQEIKTSPDLGIIPVVMLSSSQSHQDVLRCYELYGNCVVTKPYKVEDFIKTIKKIESFWLNVVQLPPQLGDVVQVESGEKASVARLPEYF